MKYENKEKVMSILDEIERHENHYAALEGTPNVVIKNEGNTVYTIGTMLECEHFFAEEAAGLVKNMRTALINRIAALKKQLEKL